MSISGTIKIVDSNGYYRKLRKFYCKAVLKEIYDTWSKLYDVVLEEHFIHISIEETEKTEPIVKTKTEYMPEISNEHMEFIKAHTAKMKPQAIADQLGISVKDVYYFNRELKPSNNRKIVKLWEFDEAAPKDPIKRPPSNYSNPRLYDAL